jgi:cyclopropane-fatty-acyl-phospholipid synthase
MEDRTSGSVSNTPVAEKSYRIYQTIFNKVLSSLPAGKLRVELPSREEFFYGLKASGPEATIKVLNPAFFKKCILYGEVGLGESYVDGDWKTDDVVGVLSWFIINLENASAAYSSKRRLPLTDLRALRSGQRFLQTLSRSRANLFVRVLQFARSIIGSGANRKVRPAVP